VGISHSYIIKWGGGRKKGGPFAAPPSRLNTMLVENMHFS
jgi:hypothetical protein